MEQLLLSLVSGIIGALLGAYVSIRINSSNRKVTAVERMLSLVHIIGFKSWWEPEKEKPAVIFHENYSELWSAYASLRSALPLWKRKGLDIAWTKYMVMDYYKDIPKEQVSRFFQKGTHKSRDEAVEKSGEFISYLTKLR